MRTESISIVAFAFSLIFKNIHQKIAPGIERKRDSIEFERSENIGQFFMICAFNYFLMFLMLLDTVKCL